MAAKKAGRRHVLSDHSRKGKRHIPPFVAGLGDYPNVGGYTWHDDVLPELIWLALLYDEFPDQQPAELAEAVLKAVASLQGIKRSAGYVITTEWARLTPGQYQTVRRRLRMAGCLSSLEKALAPLVWLYPECPMAPAFRSRRRRPDRDERQQMLEAMRRATASLLVRRTREAVILEGIAVYAAVLGGGLSPNGLELRDLLHLHEFPASQESRRGAQMVRMVTAMLARTSLLGPSWREYFWRQGLVLDSCRLADTRFQAGAADLPGVAEAIFDIFERLSKELETEFNGAWAKCPIDLAHPRRWEVLGGLLGRQVRYVRHLLVTPGLLLDEIGHLLLRSMVESAITLTWLAQKGTADDFQRFVEFGLGQEKLALEHLKASQPEPSRYLEQRRQRELGARAEWLESQRFPALVTVDVSTGWKNLHAMAVESGTVDLYNSVFTPTSAQVHGSWNAIARTSMRYCLNPLHRLHLTPDVDTTRVDLSTVIVGLRILESSWEALRHCTPEIPQLRCVPEALVEMATVLDAKAAGAGEGKP